MTEIRFTVEEARAFAERYGLISLEEAHMPKLAEKMGEIAKAGLAVPRPDSKFIAPAMVFIVSAK